MQRKMTKEFLKELKEFYTPGTKVRLVKMKDTQAPPVGTIGEVTLVDDIGTVHVKWENGSTLGVVFGEDVINPVDKVITICYDKKENWNSRKEAMEHFLCCMMNSEGSEHERYCKVYEDLACGKLVCVDEDLT